jgi:beta-N-acetylhexosaminidase
VPSTLSRRVVSGLLRGELGFDGLVMSDSLMMQSVRQMASPGEAAVRALQAGNDLVLEPPDPRAAMDAIIAAVRQGTIAAAQIDASVQRVLESKARLGLHVSRVVDLDGLAERIGSRPHQAVADEVSRRSITLVRDERQSVPLAASPDSTVLYLSVLDYTRVTVAAPSRTFRPELEKRWPNLTAIEISDRTSPSELDLVRAMAPRFDAIIAGVFVRAASGSGRPDLAPTVVRLLQALARISASQGIPFVTTFFGNPYAVMAIPELPAMVLTYDLYDRAEAAAVRALAGEAPIGGRLPVTLPALYPAGHGIDREVRDAAAVAPMDRR